MDVFKKAEQIFLKSKARPQCRRVILRDGLVPVYETQINLLFATNADRLWIHLSDGMRTEMFRLIAEGVLKPLVYRSKEDFRRDYPALPKAS